MPLGDKINKIKSQIKNKGLEITRKTEISEKKSAPLNVSFDINERMFLKQWAKKEGHSMAVIIKKSLKEYYLRHEMEVEMLHQNRLNRLKQKQLNHSK